MRVFLQEMATKMTHNKANYKPKDFAELLGVYIKTLQRGGREETSKANRTSTNRRYYTYDQHLQFTSIVAVNNEELLQQEELVQDIVSILHVFSCRLCGLRKYKKINRKE